MMYPFLQLPDYKWEEIHGFSEAEMDYYKEYVESIAHIILELSQRGGFDNAANL